MAATENRWSILGDFLAKFTYLSAPVRGRLCCGFAIEINKKGRTILTLPFYGGKRTRTGLLPYKIDHLQEKWIDLLLRSAINDPIIPVGSSLGGAPIHFLQDIMFQFIQRIRELFLLDAFHDYV
jgi:hypothetical protein